jgi:hypothetical protein
VKRSDKKYVVDVANAIDAPDSRTASTIGELLAQGTPAEVRDTLAQLGLYLRSGIPLPATAAEALGEALERIGKGENPWDVFRLRRNQRYGVRYRKQMAFLIDDLVRQGAPRDLAERIVADLDLRTYRLRSDATGGTAVDGLRKRLGRTPTK